MRRSLTLALLAALLALVPATQALAGGAVMRPDRDAYVPGELATARGTFSKNGSLEGTLADGPYVAWLLPEGVWIEGTRVPAAAIRLGELRIWRPDGSYPRAVARFAVPYVPAGWYHVGYCNEPCTVNGIGDLMGSSGFVVAPTRLEGRHLVVVNRLEGRIQNVRHRAVVRARAERRELERALEARVAEARDVRDPIAALEAALASERAEDRTLLPGWAAILLAGAILAGAVALGRRRATRYAVPDTLPEDLVERYPTSV